MSCEKSFLISDKNIHVFARVHGQTTWTRADRVPLITDTTQTMTRQAISVSTVDDDFAGTFTGTMSVALDFNYLYGVDIPTDTLFQVSKMLNVPIEILEVVGDYPDASATSNEYSLGCYYITGLTRVTATNAVVKRTLTLVSANKPTFGANLTTVDPTDGIAPTVTLASNTLTVTSDQTITLTATASDNVGVFKVEFWEGAVLLGTDFSGAFDWTIPYTSANNGTHTYTAKAFDAAGNVTTSNAVTVNVNIVASMYPAGMIYGLNMIDVVGSQLIPLPEAENQTPANILGGAAQTWGMNALRATWNFGDPALLAANGSEGLTYYAVSELGGTLGGSSEQYPVLTDFPGTNYTWAQTAVHFVRDYWGSGFYNQLGWGFGRGGDAPTFNAPSAEIVSPKPEPSAFGISSAILRVGPTFGGAPSAADLGLKAIGTGGTYDQTTPTVTNPNPATLTPTRNILGIGTTADNLDATNGGAAYVFGGKQTFYYLLIFRGEHDLATETAVITQMRAELALRGVALP